MSFLSPLAALVAVAVVLPLAAHALLELRARRVSRRLELQPPPLRSRLGIPGAIAVVAGMLARDSAEAPTRFETAKTVALRLRHAVPDVPVGIASLTDRVLPHLFPTLESHVFESTLRDALGIERPPPAGTGDLATDFNSVGTIGTNNYYRPNARKRLLVVFSDGESRFFDEAQIQKDLQKGNVHVLFVHLWAANEKIYLRNGRVDPGYRPDPQAPSEARRLAAAGAGEVLSQDPGILISRAKAFLGSGAQTKVREQRTRVSLGPYVALAALLPLGFVLLRRNL